MSFHSTDELIDESGKIRNVFTRAQPGTEDSVSQVIRIDADTGAVTQLTFDAGQKFVPFMWFVSPAA